MPQNRVLRGSRRANAQRYELRGRKCVHFSRGAFLGRFLPISHNTLVPSCVAVRFTETLTTTEFENG